METQYILIRKNKSEAKSIRIQNEVKTVLKDATFDVEDNFIYLSESHQEKYLTYRMSVEDNNTLYLNIETQINGEFAAKLLDEFDERFVNGYHRRKFYIINAYSDSSYWFCSKLMPKIGTFERRLREFIFLTVTGVYGSEWIKNLNSEIIENLKERSHGKINQQDSLIEKSLEWLEFNQIEDLLFTPRIYDDVDVDSVISEILTNTSFSKEEVLAKIKMIEKTSLWDRDFQEFSEIKNLQTIFGDVRDIRNTVMHNKAISFKYFNESMIKIDDINKQLGKAIDKIEKDIYDKPKNRKTIVFDSRVFVEAIIKSIQQDEEFKKKVELGKRLTEKYNSIYGSVKLADLINAQVQANDTITKKIGNG
ncbi:MAG: hypothetical protein IKB93_15510 [Clostridia bacterium]|nr:hypothetical protein [Clostridia bacterium]